MGVTMALHKPEVLNLGAGGDTHAEQWNVDREALPGIDEVVDLDDHPWPWDRSSFMAVRTRHVLEHLADPAHFFAEAGRVVKPGGMLRVVLPLGEWTHTDLDHEHRWEWNTPRQFCVDAQRPWDPETDWRLVRRELETHLGGPLAPLTPLWQWAERHWPTWAAHRCFAGELTAVYRRVGDD